MPFADASFDAAMSSFVLQLVPSRPKALREIRRVLRPGGRLEYVTWLVDERAFAPDRIFDALLAEFGYEDEEDRPRTGDIASVERAVGELRRAGSGDVTRPALLDHAFTVDGYIAFLAEFDEETLFEEMGRADRRRFLTRFRERLMALDPDELSSAADRLRVGGPVGLAARADRRGGGRAVPSRIRRPAPGCPAPRARRPARDRPVRR